MTSSKTYFNNTEKTRMFIILLFMISLMQLGIFIYLPALPEMVGDFSTSTSMIQHSISLYLLGLGVSQIIYGPISDFYGRKQMFVYGFSLYILATILILIFPQKIDFFLMSRFVQGLGLGCVGSVGRAIILDLYEGKPFIKANSIVSATGVIVPLLGPVVGGYITSYFDWINVFKIMLFVSITLLLLVVVFFKETLEVKSRETFSHIYSSTYKNSKVIFSNKTFWRFFIIIAVILLCETIYQILSPFIMQVQFGLTKIQYGWTVLPIELGFLIGSLATIKLCDIFNKTNGIKLGLNLMVWSTLIIFILHNLSLINLSILLVLMFIFSVGSGFSLPFASSGAQENFKHCAGTIGMLISGSQMIIAGLGTVILTVAITEGTINLGAVLFPITIVTLLLFVFLSRR